MESDLHGIQAHRHIRFTFSIVTPFEGTLLPRCKEWLGFRGEDNNNYGQVEVVMTVPMPTFIAHTNLWVVTQNTQFKIP